MQLDLNLQADKRSLYQIELPDIGIVRFCLLTLSSLQRVNYLQAINPSLIPYLQDEVCKACIISPEYLIHQISELKAGISSVIADSIYYLSGPNDINLVQQQLDIERNQVSDVIKQMIMIICRAFPGYTPDDLFSMDWQNLLSRFAIAERMLLDSGVLSEPLQLRNPTDNNKKKSGRPDKIVKTKPNEKIITAGTSFNLDSKDVHAMNEELAVSPHDRKEVNKEKQKMLEFAREFVARKQKEQEQVKGK